jgi:alanine dehydrogenase
MRLLSDDDVRALLPAEIALAAMERALRLQAEGRLDAPPRTSVGGDAGRLVLTIGADTGPHGPAGFRAYHTAPTAFDQLVSVFDGTTGELEGVVVGRALGNLRTAAINALAIRAMARSDARVLGIIGSGRQATGIARLTLAARTFAQVQVYSPRTEQRRAFARALASDTGVEALAVDDAETATRAADVLILATTSRRPVLDAAWLRPGTHVSSVGPKGRGAAELPAALGTLARCIATDSVAQASAYYEPYFLDPDDFERMVGLERILTGEIAARDSAEDVTLFCSMGLAGTEVVLADALLTRHAAAASAAALQEAGGATGAGPSTPTEAAAEAAAAHGDATVPGPPRAVHLEPLVADELEPYLARMVPAYAAGHVRAGNWPDTEAEERGWQQIRELLPAGVDTPGQELCHIVDSASGERVGHVWTMLQQAPGGREAFVLDLEVAPKRRRRGYAAAALAEVEARARAAGALRVGLHVFGDNPGAFKLYRRSGFAVADISMAKPL